MLARRPSRSNGRPHAPGSPAGLSDRPGKSRTARPATIISAGAPPCSLKLNRPWRSGSYWLSSAWRIPQQCCRVVLELKDRRVRDLRFTVLDHQSDAASHRRAQADQHRRTEVFALRSRSAKPSNARHPTRAGKRPQKGARVGRRRLDFAHGLVRH